MSDELKELVQQQIDYYRYHGVGNMIKNKPGFVEQDYQELLNALEKEIRQ